MMPKRTPDQRLATVDRQIAQLRLALGTLVVWLQSSAHGVITTKDAEDLLKLLDDPK